MTDEPEPRRESWLDVFTPILLLVGGLLLPFVGWLIGIVLLWASHAWTLRDKLIGTLVLPGGLMLPVFLLTAAWSATAIDCDRGVTTTEHTEYFVVCGSDTPLTGSVWLLLLVGVLFVAPLLATVHLIRRARTEPPRPAPTP